MKKIFIWASLMLLVCGAAFANFNGAANCVLDGTNTTPVDSMFRIKSLSQNSKSKAVTVWSLVNAGPGNVTFSLYTTRDSTSGTGPGQYVIDYTLFHGQTYSGAKSGVISIDSVFIDRAATDLCSFFGNFDR